MLANPTAATSKHSTKADRPEVPAALADLALIDGPTAAATAGLSVSKWLDLVSQGKAPLPAIRQPRFSRWTVASVREWLTKRIAAGSLEGETAEAGKAMQSPSRAGEATRTKRRAGTRTAP